MDDEQKLDALTNQRVSFTFGGKEYTARRATLHDIGLLNKYTQERQKSGDTANLELDGELYILCELMKPDFTCTPEELAQRIDLTQYDDITKPVVELQGILAKLGFKMPQLPKEQEIQ